MNESLQSAGAVPEKEDCSHSPRRVESQAPGWAPTAGGTTIPVHYPESEDGFQDGTPIVGGSGFGVLG